jgi:hypothetical protein
MYLLERRDVEHVLDAESDGEGYDVMNGGNDYQHSNKQKNGGDTDNNEGTQKKHKSKKFMIRDTGITRITFPEVGGRGSELGLKRMNTTVIAEPNTEIEIENDATVAEALTEAESTLQMHTTTMTPEVLADTNDADEELIASEPATRRKSWVERPSLW